MRFLIDTSAETLARKATLYPSLVAGQLLTPLTRYRNCGGVFAVDNGAFSRFDREAFVALLNRDMDQRKQCLWVAVPDVVGSARRTLEIWRHGRDVAAGWPLALVAQDGIENLDIPWDEMAAVFIGGRDPWKDSQAALDVVRCAKVLGKQVHVGRVNTPKRYKLYAAAGADTCDGSGVAMYDHMLQRIAAEIKEVVEPMLFDQEDTA